jgi:hypothetical protein
MKEQIPQRKPSAGIKGKLVMENLSRETFSEILDGLPSMFRFRLINTNKDFDGYWEKTIKAGKTVWHKDDKCLSSYSFFEFKKQILDAIDKERGVYYRVNGNWHALKPILINNGAKQIVTRKKGDISQILTKEKLKWLYYKEKKSLEDIAKEYGTTRQTILRIMKKHEIIRRGRSRARIEAIQKGKFENLSYEDDIDGKFFSKWSAGMAWALGLLFTDGHIHSNGVQFTSIDADLLEKVRALFQSSKPIQKRTQSYNKSKHIYVFAFSHPKIAEDLRKLGLHEKKSLDMVFPEVPEECMRHFIRGCWDGDGSVYITAGKINANYISGSLKFIEGLVQQLQSIGIYNKIPPYSVSVEKSVLKYPLRDRSEIFSHYPDGRFPIPIHKDKRAKAYYFRIHTSDNLGKLFHYFYDGVDESMYLSRKYNVFVKGLNLGKKDETEQLILDLDF